MLVPSVGSPGGKRDVPITSTPPGTSEVTELAQEAIENPILGQAELRNVKMSPKGKVPQRVTKAAFKLFAQLNKPTRS